MSEAEALTPDSYPADCSITASELEELKEAFLDDDTPVGQYIDNEWPPRDDAGNPFPIWFTYEDLDNYGKLLDDCSTRFDPFAGNLEPITRETWGCCNAPLDKWRKRYPEVRFCGRISNSPGDEADNPTEYTYCPVHKNRKHTMKSAEEHMQTGLFAQSIDHVYARLNPWQQLLGWGTFESLMGESSYEFGIEYKPKEFDFSEEPIVPDGVDEDGILEAKCGYPTDYVDPALSLYVAAMMGVQMIAVQPRIMEESREDGKGMMESKTPEYADLTAPPSEHDPSPQEYKTLETWSEHHLNLPFSRLVKDRPRLLERGGVTTDADDQSGGPSNDEIVLELEADPDTVDTAGGGTDPNTFEDSGYESESEKIVASAESDD